MQSRNEITEFQAVTTVDRRRVETVVEALATVGNQGETLSEVAHDARNMVTALGLYCDLLDEPGVLSTPFLHYGQELRLVAAASRRLVEKLVAIDAQQGQLADQAAMGQPWLAGERFGAQLEPTSGGSHTRTRLGATNSIWRNDLLPAMPVANLAAELLANRNLLSALAGPGIVLTVDAKGGTQPVRITAEDLTRVLVNLVKNAAEALPTGGRIHITLQEHPAGNGTSASVVLAVEDNGPGIPAPALESIFTSGFTTRNDESEGNTRRHFRHRGLGLAITRSIVEAAGGRITARNRDQGGAQVQIELPVRNDSFQRSAFRCQL